MRRILQPPVDPARRDPEEHGFLLPLAGAVVAVVLVLLGARNLTGIETVDGGAARETQLVKAFSSGGLKFPGPMSPPPPPVPGNPMATAAALERWERENAAAATARWKVRVDPAAASPCPT